MLERKSTGVTLEADGTVRVVELSATIRTVTLSKMETFTSESTELFSSWQHALAKGRESGFDLENSVVGITDSMTYRKVMQFPFRSRKRIVQILESELEGEIPVPSETVVADFLPGIPVDKGIRGIALACSKQTLTRVLETFGGGTRLKGVQTLSTGLAAACRAAGVRDGVAVHVTEGEAILVEIRSGFLVSIRRIPSPVDLENDMESIAGGILDMAVEEDDVILVCRNDIDSGLRGVPGMDGLKVRSFSDLSIPGLISGINEEPTDYAIGFGLALRGLGRRESIALDLRQGPFGQMSPLANLKEPLKRTASIGLLVILLLVTGLLIQTGTVKGEYERYSKQLEAEFKENFPDLQYRRNTAVEMARQRLENLQGRMTDLSGFDGTGILKMLSRLSSAIPAEISMKIDELSYDSRKLRIEGTVPSFDAVDKVKSALDREPFFTEVQVQNARIGADVNRINFRLQMEVR
jgi:Tfp pilus assembly protein PilN